MIVDHVQTLAYGLSMTWEKDLVGNSSIGRKKTTQKRLRVYFIVIVPCSYTKQNVLFKKFLHSQWNRIGSLLHHGGSAGRGCLH